MSIHKPTILGAMLLCLTFASASKAAILANYNFDANSSSNDTDTSSTASIFTDTFPSDSDRSTGGNYFARIEVTPLVLDTTLYLSFTVEAASGNILNLTSLAFRSSLSASSTTTPFNGSVIVRSSVDNFTADLATFTQARTTAVDFTSRLVDLSGSQFQNLTAITFHFYLIDGSDDSTGSSFVHRIDDVVLNGDAIPEPSTFGLATFAGLSFFTRRKR